MKWRVLVSAPYFIPVVERYRGRFEAEDIEIIIAEVRERLSEVELLGYIPEVDGAICGDDRFTRRVFSRAPRLKVISKWGTGIDSIDLDAAGEHNIKVYNTPNAFTDPVADTTLGYILSFARKIPWLDRSVKTGGWSKSPGFALNECTLGIVGLGNIGRAVAKRAGAFGMSILATDPKPSDSKFLSEYNVEMVELSALLESSDFVSLHCDLNPTSFHLITRKELEHIRSSSYLINTARGPIIDELDLAQALLDQTIAGAALDVFEEEPLPLGSPLRSIDNCLLAPHNSNSSPAAWLRVHESTIDNLIQGLKKSARW